MKILRIIEVVIIGIGVLYLFAISMQVNQMKRKAKKLKKRERGSLKMSKIISELIGKKCKIIYADGLSTEMCEIIDADEEWAKIKVDSKKEKNAIKIIRIDGIDQVSVLEN